jgi:hypothetical protein
MDEDFVHDQIVNYKLPAINERVNYKLFKIKNDLKPLVNEEICLGQL